jgi:2,3-diaminopropionate biosynthesis protein SbnA
VPYVQRPEHLILDDVFVDLSGIVGQPLSLKCEGFNFAGSIKLKTAAFMVTAAEEAAMIKPGSILIESSSGNLGVALSIVAASRGYEFVCVMDPRSSALNRRRIEASGGRVVVVDELDDNGGYLATRIRAVQRLCDSDGRYYWLNQYANDNNWRAHYHLTAPRIAEQFPDLDYLFVGAGTTGTVTGCAHYLRDVGHPAQIIAVDSTGSVTFSERSGPRFIPGLGTSFRPEIADRTLIDDVVFIDEPDTVRMCRLMAQHGFLFGGSTGTVVAGATDFLRRHAAEGSSGLAISADLGDGYLDTVYDDDWVSRHYEGSEGRLPRGETAVPGKVVER